MRWNTMAAAVLLWGLAFGAGEALATCGYGGGELALAREGSCQAPKGATYESDERVAVYGHYWDECCAPGEDGPTACSVEFDWSLGVGDIEIRDAAGALVEATFVETGDLCGEHPRMVLDRDLTPGEYEVVATYELEDYSQGEERAAFTVVPATDADGGCDVGGGAALPGLACLLLLAAALLRRARTSRPESYT